MAHRPGIFNNGLSGWLWGPLGRISFCSVPSSIPATRPFHGGLSWFSVVVGWPLLAPIAVLELTSLVFRLQARRQDCSALSVLHVFPVQKRHTYVPARLQHQVPLCGVRRRWVDAPHGVRIFPFHQHNNPTTRPDCSTASPRVLGDRRSLGPFLPTCPRLLAHKGGNTRRPGQASRRPSSTST